MAFLRPWYWDLAIAVVAWRHGAAPPARPSPRAPAAPRHLGAIGSRLASVVLGSALVHARCHRGRDRRGRAGGRARPSRWPTTARCCAHPVLYQVFWGPSWDDGGPPRHWRRPPSFQRALPPRQWAAAVVGAGFGVGSLTPVAAGSTPLRPASSEPASSTSSGPFPAELRRVLTRPRTPRSRARASPPPRCRRRLPPDAVVALWLDPGVPYQLGGVSAHGCGAVDGAPDGLADDRLDRWVGAVGDNRRVRRARRAVPSPASPSPTYALSHELVEAVTNPFGQGWFADVPLRWAARYFLSHGPTSLLSTRPRLRGRGGRPVRAGPARQRPLARWWRRSERATIPVADFYRPGTGCVW